MRTTNTTGQSGRRAVERRGKRAWALIGLAAAALLGLGLLGVLAATPVFAQQPATSDASLSGLELSGFTGEQQPKPVIALRPAFDAATLSYGASAAYTRQVRLRATATQAGATITVDGQTVASGAYSQTFTLRDNQPKRIELRVRAPDGATERVYALTATNNPAADLRDLSLSPVELHPSTFATSQQAYTAYAAYSVESVRVTATRRHGVETLTVNGQQVTSGQASDPIALELGANLITVVATAPDQYTSKSYSITVTRATEAQSSDATLSGISVYQATSFQPDNGNNVPYEGEPLPLTPAVSSTVREYQAEKAEQAGQSDANDWYVAVAVTTNAPGAKSIVVDGPDVNLERRDPKDEVVSGEASGPWQIALGYRLITITVTSLDGKNTETYRLVIKYGTVDELPGLRLSSGDGSLTVHWDASDSPTAATEYQLRWRKAGETSWLNRGFPAGWKTSYALDAADAGPADGHGYFPVSQGSETLSGLENGVAYEVHVRGARGSLTPRTGERRVFVFLRNDWRSLSGTPGQTRTALAITPSSPSREYGGVDDLSYTVSGLLDGDAAADVLTGGLSRAAGADVGRYAIGMGTLAVANDYAAKYELASAPTTSIYEITPRPIPSISGVTVKERDADGTTTASFDTSAAVGTDVLAAELADFRAGGLQVTGSFPTAAAGRHNLAVTYALRDQGSFKAANYSLTQTTGTLQGELTAPPTCAAGLMLFADGVPAEGGAPVTVTVGLSSPAGVGGASVTLTATGTATGDDYTLSSTIVVIAEGATAGTATITVIDDALDDDDETIVLNAALSGSNLTAGPLTLTIADNDPLATPTPVAADGCSVPAGGDYDIDNDGLIEVSCLAQLNAIRWDLDGNGNPGDAEHGWAENSPAYARAFAGSVPGMGCPAGGCQGYELTGDLDFDSNGSGVADAGDTYWNGGRGWIPIGEGLGGFAADFEGNSHVIRNLYVVSLTPAPTAGWSEQSVQDTVEHSAGLFGLLLNSGAIRNLGLEAAYLDTSAYSRRTGAVAGVSDGLISRSYVSGALKGQAAVGALVGFARGKAVIIDSYSSASVEGTLAGMPGGFIGGLVGYSQGDVLGSYSTGVVSGKARSTGGLVGFNDYGSSIVASYKYGNVSSSGWRVGGLLGVNQGRVAASYFAGQVSGGDQVGSVVGHILDHRIMDSYWDTRFTGSGSWGQPTAELQSPSGYAGIYASWNVDLNGDGSPDDPWDFGESDEYPVLKRGIRSVDAQRQGFPANAPPATTAPEPSASLTPSVPSAGQRVNLVASLDLKAAGYDDAILRSMSLPQGVTMDPAFQSGVHSYQLTVPNDVDRLTFAGRFERMKAPGSGEAWSILVVEPGDLTLYELFLSNRGFGKGTPYDGEYVSNYFKRAIVANLQRTAGVHTIALPPDAATVIKIAVYKTRIDDHRGFAPADAGTLARKTVYTLTVTRGDAGAGDAEQSAPTVAAPIANVTGLVVGATRDISLSGVFSDVDSDSLTITAASSDETKATVAVASDYSKLTLTSVAVGTTTITVTAADGNGGTVSDSFTVTVKSAPTVALPIADVTGLVVGATRDISLSGVFSDADGDSLTITAASSDETRATVTVAADDSKLTVAGVAAGTATITVTAEDADGERVSDTFQVAVEKRYAALIAQVVEWRNHPNGVNNQSHTDRWDRALLALGETVADTSLTPMTTAEAEQMAAQHMATRWNPVVAALREIEAAGQRQTPANQPPTVASAINDLSGLKPGARRTVSLSGVFSDADGDALTISARSSAVAVATVSVAGNGASLTVSGVAQGAATITVTANDGRGGTVSDRLTVTVAANAPPTLVSPLGDISGLKPGATRTVSLAGVFRDPNGDSLTLTARSTDESVATVAVAAGGGSLTVTGVSGGTATITVSADDGDGATALDSFTVEVDLANAKATLAAANAAPTVASAIGDLNGLTPGATRTVSLAGVFQDADGDELTITAKSSAAAVATVSVTSGGASLTVTAVAEGTATITVTADDGKGGTVSDSFTVTVAAANAVPRVASAIGDLSGLTPGATRAVSLAGVFQDADGDSLTITAKSSTAAVATVSVASGGASLTVTAVAEGTATITVTANDGKGGTVSDSFTVTVAAANAAPRVASAIGDLSGLRQGDTRQVLLLNVFQDADGDALTFSARSSSSAIASVASANASLTVTAVAEGTATITVTADDGKGGTVSDSFTVMVAAANAAPRAVRSMDDVNGLTAGTTRRVLVADHFRDADNDPLTLTASSSNETVVRVSVDGRNYSMTLSAVSAGTATITVTADDGQGGRASASFRVTVNAAPASEPEEQDSGLEGEPEQQLVVQDVITRYDTNGDGEISLDEYNAAIPDLGTTLSFADLLKLRAAFQASSR